MSLKHLVVLLIVSCGQEGKASIANLAVTSLVTSSPTTTALTLDQYYTSNLFFPQIINEAIESSIQSFVPSTNKDKRVAKGLYNQQINSDDPDEVHHNSEFIDIFFKN